MLSFTIMSLYQRRHLRQRTSKHKIIEMLPVYLPTRVNLPTAIGLITILTRIRPLLECALPDLGKATSLP